MAMLMPVLGQARSVRVLKSSGYQVIPFKGCKLESRVMTGEYCHIATQMRSIRDSLVLGTAYPIYSSLALLESDAPPAERAQEASQWLTYWAVFGVLSAAEQLIDKKPWGYYHIKLLFLIWLQSSRYQGARRLYIALLRPLMIQHMAQIETFLQLCRQLLRRPEVAFLGDWLHRNMAKVPYLEWFVRPIDGPGADGRRFFL